MSENKKSSIFSSVINAGRAGMDLFVSRAQAEMALKDAEIKDYLAKSRSEIAEQEDDAFWRKSVYRDINYTTSSQGYLERGTKIGFQHLRAMSAKDTIVAAIIQTRQNQVASFSKFVQESSQMGFRIVRKNEEEALQKVIEDLFGKQDDTKAKIKKRLDKQRSAQTPIEASKDNKDDMDGEDAMSKSKPGIDAGGNGDEDFGENDPLENLPEKEVPSNGIDMGPESFGQPEEEEPEVSDRDKRRMAKEELKKRDQKKVMSLGEFVENCGHLEDRPFDALRWNFNAYLRAVVRDTYTCDMIATETINDEAQRPHYFVPVDSTTIRLTTPEITEYRQYELNNGYDILYPEKELEGLKETTDAFNPDEEKLENFDYKYAQIVKGRIERLFTPEELSLTMRNPTTDIYANGYSMSELELLVGTVTSHIFTENYNHSYFTQGFSAKGILHLKAPVNRRKLETIRLQWKHMISGAKNSFQTPIFAGMDEVQWIPLTQNHSDMEFSNWMNYLIKIITSIYQIDPTEIGFGMRDEGSKGGGLGGDNTAEKLENSKDKGLIPLLDHISTYLNSNIISRIDPDFKLEFSGMSDESSVAHVDRLAKEVKFMKSINDIREEQGLPPIEGADDLILDPTYFQWYSAFHPEGQKKAEKDQVMQAAMSPPGEEGEGDQPSEPSPFGKSALFKKKSAKKPVVIEYYYSK